MPDQMAKGGGSASIITSSPVAKALTWDERDPGSNSPRVRKALNRGSPPSQEGALTIEQLAILM